MPRAKYFRTNQARNKQMRDLSKSTSMIFSTQETSSDEPLISKETPLEFPEDPMFIAGGRVAAAKRNEEMKRKNAINIYNLHVVSHLYN